MEMHAGGLLAALKTDDVGAFSVHFTLKSDDSAGEMAHHVVLLPSAGRRITPTPQRYVELLGPDGKPAAVDLRGWAITSSASVGALPLARLVTATAARRVSRVQDLPPQRAIALGVTSENADFEALAAAHGVSLHPAATSEGYALLISEHIVLVLGNSAAGVFYGVQSLQQLLDSTVAMAARVDDWPDFPIRGALMSEMTEMNNLNKLDVPCWDRTPPHTSGGFCAHFNYVSNLRARTILTALILR